MGDRKWSLELFEVLARGCRSALGLSSRRKSPLPQSIRMFAIPPRQRLPSPSRLEIRGRRVTLAVVSDENSRVALERRNKQLRKRVKSWRVDVCTIFFHFDMCTTYTRTVLSFVRAKSSQNCTKILRKKQTQNAHHGAFFSSRSAERKTHTQTNAIKCRRRATRYTFR